MPNRDIGFVSAGQEAQVKIDSFNFTKYGLIPFTRRHRSKKRMTRGSSYISLFAHEAMLQVVGEVLLERGVGLMLKAGPSASMPAGPQIVSAQ